MKNKIAKLVDIEKVEIFEEDLRSLGSGEILVKIKSSGICGSENQNFLVLWIGLLLSRELPVHVFVNGVERVNATYVLMELFLAQQGIKVHFLNML
jgi:threonine dehydrogenase-like Zn-dependent dehydrogenase